MKKDKILTLLFIIAALGFLIGFYFVVYKPFESKKSFLYVKSDFSQTETGFAGLKNKLVLMLTDNTVSNEALYSNLEYIRQEAISNSEYLNSTSYSGSEVGILLTGYYSDIQYLTDQLRPKAAFGELADQLTIISSRVETEINSTDNYSEIADFIDSSLVQVNSIESGIDDNILSNYSDLNEIVSEYLADIKVYFTDMIPLIRSVPEYLAKNDRDQTRLIMSQIETLSTQYKGNEANLDQMARDYFQQTNVDVAVVIDRINASQTDIASKLSALSI